MKTVKLNGINGGSCPHCHANIITPEGLEPISKAWPMQCGVCGRKFKVKVRMAKEDDDLYLSDQWPVIPK